MKAQKHFSYQIKRLANFHFIRFLKNLDALHDHLGTLCERLFEVRKWILVRIFNLDPGMRAPSFRCTTEPDGSLILHYYSERPGLEHIVIGIVKVWYCNWEYFFIFQTQNISQAVASKLHDVEVDIKVIKRKGDLINPSQTIDADNNENKIEPDQKNSTTKSHDTTSIKTLPSDICE